MEELNQIFLFGALYSGAVIFTLALNLKSLRYEIHGTKKINGSPLIE